MGSTRSPTRVLLVGPDTLALFGIASVLAARDELTIVAECKPGEELEQWLAEGEADIAVWDLGPGPSMDSETLERFTRGDNLPVIVMLADARGSRDALAAGARGVLSRDADADRVVAAIVSVTEGLVVLESSLVPPSLQTGAPPYGEIFESLTPRETEVIQLLAQGLTNKAIAERLQISEHTVKFHLNSLLGKLGARSRTDALVKAARLGLIAL